MNNTSMNETTESLTPVEKNTGIKLPYFDYLLSVLKAGNAAIEQSFGRHVHWGYWEFPEQATLTGDDFAQATENLSQQVCLAGHITHGLKVLDVGCGFGGTVAHINERYQGMDLTGLNLDERQLERARASVIPQFDNRIAFQQGNACALPFPDHCFDVVLAVECIFHFPDRQQFFNEAYRVLKPGGRLALSDFIPSNGLLPFTKMNLFGGFYGHCNVRCSTVHYQELAQQTQFTVEYERDITVNTLPTYTYLRQLARQHRIYKLSALIETLTVELLSRSALLKYYIYGFQR